MYENYQVLFVDDEEDVLKSLKRGLIDEEYHCLFASDAYKALELMENTQIAVLVSDMRMPGMDGLKFLKEVRSRWPKTVRIVLSGYVQLPQILLAINQAGVFRFITKPWRLENELIGTIKEALDEYIADETAQNYMKNLENQKALHLTMIRKLEAQTQYYKMNIDFLTIMGKSILEVFKSSELTALLSEFVLSLYSHAKIISLVDREIDVNVFYKIITAVIQASTILFNDVFGTSELTARIGVESNDYYCVYLVSSFDKVSPEEQISINQKLTYFSTVLEDMSVFNLNCFADTYNQTIVIGVFVNNTLP